MPDILAGMPAEVFLRNHWQQQPLLIRAAMPAYAVPVTADELAGLALQPEVESRLIMERGEDGPWTLQLGPFDADHLSRLPPTHWSLLVQALDLWVPEVRELLTRFDFLPRWRIDDVMASFAPEGGSVGPHFDQYDVFLLQVEGRRRWQVGAQCGADDATVAGTPLNILADFVATQEWVLEPGDMLYLPPRVAHWGVALEDCMTFSVGFRAPSMADLLAELAVDVATHPQLPHYRDPAMTLAMASETIDPAFIRQVQSQLMDLLADEALLADWFARYMTQPKLPGYEDLTGERRTARVAGRRYVNGELFD